MSHKKISASAAYIAEFYLTDEQKEKARKMGRFRRGIYSSWWVFRGMIDKLSQTRRIMVVIGTLLFFFEIRYGGARSDFSFVGYILIILVLMLELKDKLLAKDELREGRAVQIALLPERSPSIPGWDAWLFSRPANDVGGDLLDFIKIEEGVFGVSLGDVSGKALPAALLMAQLQSTIRAVIPFSDSGSDLVAKVNSIFNRYGLKKSFISLVFMTLKPASDVIKFVNAGHPPPLLVGGGKIQEQPKGGVAIGLKPELEIVGQQITIGPGDCLVVYSDGVVDARNPEEEFYGTERLHRALLEYSHLPAKEMGERVLSEIDDFIREAPRYDDLSLVIIKRAVEQ